MHARRMCRPYLVGIGLTVSDGPADGETDVQYGDVEGAGAESVAGSLGAG